MVLTRTIPTKNSIGHNWNKMSFSSLEKRGFDIYRCAICSTTGRRYESEAFVTPDENKIHCNPKKK
jgi:hypothetical protein